MSLALTDLLIDVAEPARLLLYRRDPEFFMHAAKLTEEDKEALRSGSPSRIRLYANAIAPEDQSDPQYRQFTMSRAASFNPALIEIDPTVHVDLQSNEQVTATGPGQIFVDERGQLYRGAPA